jgi:hypothetical protein
MQKWFVRIGGYIMVWLGYFIVYGIATCIFLWILFVVIMAILNTFGLL